MLRALIFWELVQLGSWYNWGDTTPSTAPPQTGSPISTTREHLAVQGASHTPKVQPLLTRFLKLVDRVPLKEQESRDNLNPVNHFERGYLRELGGRVIPKLKEGDGSYGRHQGTED